MGPSVLRTCAILFTWLNLVFEALLLVVIVAGRRQGLSSGEIGVLVAVIGACVLAGSALAPTLQRVLSMRALVIGGFWINLCVAVFLVKPSVYVLLAGSVPSVLIMPSVNAVVIGYRTAIVPDRLIGRVTSVMRTLALFGSPHGPLVAGFLLGSFSARETLEST